MLATRRRVGADIARVVGEGRRDLGLRCFVDRASDDDRGYDGIIAKSSSEGLEEFEDVGDEEEEAPCCRALRASFLDIGVDREDSESGEEVD
jgi:hypothetical protein